MTGWRSWKLKIPIEKNFSSVLTLLKLRKFGLIDQEDLLNRHFNRKPLPSTNTKFVQLLEQFSAVIDVKSLHSVSLGALRLPKNNFNRVHKLFLDEALFAQNLALNNDIISYPLALEQEMMALCEQRPLHRVPPGINFPCNWHD